MIKSCQNVIITRSQRFESYFSRANARYFSKGTCLESYFSNFLGMEPPPSPPPGAGQETPLHPPKNASRVSSRRRRDAEWWPPE
jgi:hypothetical protein